MSQTFTSSITGATIAAACLVCASTAGLAGRTTATNRTVYVSVVDKSGAPVTDMKAADLEVKEGGKVMEIVSVRQAAAPLRIAVIDSDMGYGAFQAGVQNFMQKLLGRAEFSLTSVLVQPKKVMDYASDPPTLIKGIEGVGRRGVQRGGQLMEAILEATKDIKVEGKRAVILVLRVGGEGTSALAGNDVREQLRKSGAILYAISTRGADRANPSATAGGTGNTMDAYTQQQQLRQDELTEGMAALQQVLGDGSRESGGHYEEVVSVTLSKSVEAIADQLINQYEVVYVLPDGVKPSDRLQVSTKRKNVNLWAPNHPM